MKNKKTNVRILLAKLGVDDHSRPLYVLSKSLRDAGFEVILLGTHQSVDSVVNTAIEEDVDIIGLSFHTSGHVGWCKEVTDLLEEKGAEEIRVVAGGIIGDDDIPLLEKMGVTGNFGPGTPLSVINEYILKLVR